ncbi:MAG: DUF2169 domain-containing protein [Lautropia sp.]
MKLTNLTRMPAAFTGGVDVSGRELLVVVVKGTFALPARGGPIRLHPEQSPLVVADTFTGEPGFSAPIAEADFAPGKPRCDVLLTGSAHAPGGRATDRVPVELSVGRWSKRFAVVGDRHWTRIGAELEPSRAQPFTRKPISYDVAYGGSSAGDDGDAFAYPSNPVGAGYRPAGGATPRSAALPNTEELDAPVRKPDGSYRPMAFGPIGRGWQPRAAFAGTYDARWRDETFPFLPEDFDSRYFQAAPADQQIDVGEQPLPIRLVNLTPDGLREFELPSFRSTITIETRTGTREAHEARLDTMAFEPDRERFSLVWRLSRPLRRNLFEIAEVIVGQPGSSWWRRRDALPFPIPVVAAEAG